MAGGLVQMLQRRNKTRDGKGQSIGKSDIAKDGNLGHDIQSLIRELKGKFRASRADDEEQDNTDPAQPNGEASDTERPMEPSQGVVGGQLESADEAQQGKEDARAVLTAIYENWDSTIREYLPDESHLESYEGDWPLGLLQLVLQLSRLIATQDTEDVREFLKKEFGSKDKYPFKKSLRLLDMIVQMLKDTQELDESDSLIDGRLGDATNGSETAGHAATTPGEADDDEELQTGVQTSTSPHTASPQSTFQKATKRSADGPLGDDARREKSPRFGQSTDTAGPGSQQPPTPSDTYRVITAPTQALAAARNSAVITQLSYSLISLPQNDFATPRPSTPAAEPTVSSPKPSCRSRSQEGGEGARLSAALVVRGWMLQCMRLNLRSRCVGGRCGVLSWRF
ncbi:uncharacterized protein M421DRAFT_8175 [Didymella exigua CBS 183.55]|uniref:Uncharacterized protein n=1 Tax=Didymella exigua CBS 183.55 TaxID=1150837 RepID=A0A6A5RCS5_9PLEO|nr:uncharacterized protein M421DRAFT_8175 [Didymella exigua CBS 183.55]KAF1925090.1 hypothetical protein M421DRAFT_8175 [Didymella exigua CBS 183.55]